MGCLPGHLISHHYWEGACPGPPRTARCPQPPSQGDTEARRVQPGRPSAGPSGAGRSRSAHACGHTQREPWTLPCTINHHKPSCPQPLKLPGALGQRDPYTGLDGGRVAWQPTRGPSGTPPASQEGEQSGPGAQRRRAEEGGPQRSVLLGKPWACEPRPCPPGLVNHAPPHTHTAPSSCREALTAARMEPGCSATCLSRVSWSVRRPPVTPWPQGGHALLC